MKGGFYLNNNYYSLTYGNPFALLGLDVDVWYWDDVLPSFSPANLALAEDDDPLEEEDGTINLGLEDQR